MIRYYSYPRLRRKEGAEVIALVEKRRVLWKAAVNRKLSEKQWEKSYVCSKHFVNGMLYIIQLI